MNPFAAFAEDDDDDFQQAPTQPKPVKKSKQSITQPTKKEKQSNSKRFKKHKMLAIKEQRSTKKFLNTLRIIPETRDTMKLSHQKKFLLKDTILTAEVVLAETIVPEKKEAAEEMLETSMISSTKININYVVRIPNL